MQPRDTDFNLQNLFDGDEELANRMLNLLKENVIELFGDLRPGYEEAFGKDFGECACF